MLGNFRRYVCGMHIYPTLRETLVKICIYLISWVVSVLCYYKSKDADTVSIVLGGSVAIFSLSILMEGIDVLDRNRNFLNKVLVIGLLGSSLYNLCYGLICIFVGQLIISLDSLIFSCIIPVLLLIIDFLTFYFIKPSLPGLPHVRAYLKSSSSDYMNCENRLRMISIDG